MKTIFLSLDTLRADRLGALGHRRGLTPNLDRIAGGGALFTQVIASDIPTQPSHTAIFTGRFGASSGIVSHFHPPAMLDEAVPWLPSLMQSAGRPTAAVDHLFAMKAWFIRGYDDYMAPTGRSRAPASVVLSMALPWLEDHANDDFFLFLHFWDAHIPYLPPDPYRTLYTAESSRWVDADLEDKLRARPSYPLFKRNLYDHLDAVPNLDYIADLYDAEVAYLDAEIGQLFGHLEHLGILDDTLVVIFGDHGENMTEHDAWFDHAGLYDSVVHVPLILRWPGHVPEVRVDQLVSLVDVMPTTLELCGMDPVEGIDGRSLLAVMENRSRHREEVMLSECTWQAKRGVRTQRWKYITTYDPGIYPRSGAELYDLANDPAEQCDVSEARPDVVAELQGRLDTWLAERLAGRRDPMAEVVEAGLPAVARLASVIADDSVAAGAGRHDGDLVDLRHDAPAALERTRTGGR